jgi:hypothetical protein
MKVEYSRPIAVARRLCRCPPGLVTLSVVLFTFEVAVSVLLVPVPDTAIAIARVRRISASCSPCLCCGFAGSL